MTPPTGHIIICGWSTHGRRLALDLQSLVPPPPITIICEPRKERYPSIPVREEVTHITGDPTDRATLVDAGAKQARIIVILSDRGHGGSPQTLDARTILTALTIREITSSVHIIAELRSENNLELAVTAGVDESILADQFSGVILSQSLQSSGLSELFNALFETGAGSTLTEERVPPELVDSTFSKALGETIGLGLGSLAGIRRGEILHLPPKNNIVLAEDDRLLLIRPV